MGGGNDSFVAVQGSRINGYIFFGDGDDTLAIEGEFPFLSWLGSSFLHGDAGYDMLQLSDGLGFADFIVTETHPRSHKVTLVSTGVTLTLFDWEAVALGTTSYDIAALANGTVTTPVPLPPTALLLGAAFLGAARWRR